MNYSLLYEILGHGKTHCENYFRYKFLPEIKDQVKRLRARNELNAKNAVRIRLMLLNNPLHGSTTFTPTHSYEYWQEEKERIEYDRYEAHFSNQD